LKDMSSVDYISVPGGYMRREKEGNRVMSVTFVERASAVEGVVQAAVQPSPSGTRGKKKAGPTSGGKKPQARVQSLGRTDKPKSVEHAQTQRDLIERFFQERESGSMVQLAHTFGRGGMADTAIAAVVQTLLDEKKLTVVGRNPTVYRRAS
jgi:hypothetical protein